MSKLSVPSMHYRPACALAETVFHDTKDSFWCLTSASACGSPECYVDSLRIIELLLQMFLIAGWYNSSFEGPQTNDTWQASWSLFASGHKLIIHGQPPAGMACFDMLPACQTCFSCGCKGDKLSRKYVCSMVIFLTAVIGQMAVATHLFPSRC